MVVSTRRALNERTRRPWCATEAEAIGFGGITQVAEATGRSKPAILRGVRQLRGEAELPAGRVRQVGGGDRPLKWKLIANLRDVSIPWGAAR